MNKSKKIKKPTHSQMIGVVDDIFNTLIKYRDNWKCVQCGTTENITAGHVIPKSSGQKIRYDTDNVFAQCQTCNSNHRYKPQYYFQWYINKYGIDEYNELVNASKIVFKYSTNDLIRLFNEVLGNLKGLNVDYREYARSKPYIRAKLNKVFPEFLKQMK